MSTIKCPDCGRTVSSDANACPHCGCPGFRIREKSGCQTIIGWIVAIGIIFALVMSNSDEKNSKSSEAAEQTIENTSNASTDEPQTYSVYGNDSSNHSVKELGDDQMPLSESPVLIEESETIQEESDASPIETDNEDIIYMNED